MKYVVLLVVVLLFWWLMRDRPSRTVPPPAATRRDAKAMVRCRHCGLHLPRDEAIAGDDGPYCSEAHRRAALGGQG